MATNDQLNWKVITDELKGGDLIPVVGPELLRITRQGRSESYRLWLAGELARELGVPSEGLDGFLHPVEQVMLRFYKQGDIRSIWPYQVVKALIGEKEYPVPESLRKLAGIKKFRFFLTTIYEPFLETAVREAWGIQDTQIRILENNLTKQPDDLTKFTLRSAQQHFDPRYIENLYKNSAPPSIYYLYGRPSRMKSYALAEDDVLEAILMLESSIYRPDELINFLSGKRLLILGCNFPNWLARFFISLTSPDPKNPAIQPVFVMSDSVCRLDSNLTDYLKRIDAQVVLDTSVETFIDQLHEVWMDVQDGTTGSGANDPFVKRSVFISYASEDREVADQLCADIQSIGLPVWLDKRALTPGEPWLAGIESNIRNCSVFIPLISPATLDSDESRFYRREWDLAIALAGESDDEGIPILPIQIGPIPTDSRQIPEPFRRLHWIDAPAGKISDDGLFRMSEIYQKTNR